MPAFAFDMTTMSGLAPVIDRIEPSVSEAPAPQFAPTASGGGSNAATASAKACGVIPIIVRPAVSKLAVTVYGMPAFAAAMAAAFISSIADIVSIQITSAPPAFRPSICSTNTSIASSWSSGPSG